MINCCTIWSWGRYAVALNGTGSYNQLEELKRTPFRKYILALDPDKAGNLGREKIKKALHNKYVRDLIIPEGKDINDLTYEEFIALEEEPLIRR